MPTVTGIWRVNSREPDRLTLSSAFSSASHTIAVTSRELGLADGDLIPCDGPAHFRLRRDAGEFTFDGSLEMGVRGQAAFDVEPEFVAGMRRIGLTLTPLDALGFAAIGVSADAARRLKAEFPEVSVQSLLSGAAFGTTPEYARAMRSMLNISSFEDLLPLAVYGVTPEFTRDMLALLRPPLGARDVASLKMAAIDRTFVAGMLDTATGRFDAKEVYRLKQLGLTPQLAAESAAARGRRLSFDELAQAAPQAVA